MHIDDSSWKVSYTVPDYISRVTKQMLDEVGSTEFALQAHKDPTRSNFEFVFCSCSML